ncbi:DUF4468 domain-containing protein [Reichenbachiella versicolor]|uniref:DUF4468 domain-containing protein n=1 Tax=Reichenbachiella versicolor TaxID=1821036 RepID=UPI0013A5B1B2|nr:DUF4468 domain-containing protein [Reichenbachiella versicolor]
MRNIFTLIAILAVIQVQAQLVKESGSYTFHQVVRAAGDKVDLYQKAEQWAKENHENTKNSIQFSSEDRGQIVLKGIFEHHTKNGMSNVAYLCTIQIRNGMYKESYGDFRYMKLNGEELHFEDKKLKGKSQILEDTHMKIVSLSASLRDQLSSQVMASEK